jgi:ATP-dependent Lhr-like helicase
MPLRVPPALKPFHPIVRRWFAETLGAPSAPQREGWPAIATGSHTLLLAPTGTGKTLAAFLWELNQLIVDGLRAPLGNAVHILYISPLKALNNDVQRNLERPLPSCASGSRRRARICRRFAWPCARATRPHQRARGCCANRRTS